MFKRSSVLPQSTDSLKDMPDTDEIVAEVSRSAISRTKPMRTDVSSFFDQGKSKRVPMTSHVEGNDENGNGELSTDKDETNIRSDEDAVKNDEALASDGAEQENENSHTENNNPGDEEGKEATRSNNVPDVVVEETTYPLPPGWKKLRIAKDAPEYPGHVYYLNEATMETQWEPPPNPALNAAKQLIERRASSLGGLAFGSKPPSKNLVFRRKFAEFDFDPFSSPGVKLTVIDPTGNGDEEEGGSQPRISVLKVTKLGQFEAAGVKVGDRIVTMGGCSLDDLEDFKKILEEARVRNEPVLTVRVKRDNTWATSRHLGYHAQGERLHTAATLSAQRSRYRGRLRRIDGGAKSSGGRKTQDRRGRASDGIMGRSNTEWNGKFYLENSIVSKPFEFKTSSTYEAKVEPGSSCRVPIFTAEGELFTFTDGTPTGKHLRPGQRFHFKSMRCITHTHTDGQVYAATMYELVWGQSYWVHDFNSACPGERTIKSDTIVFAVPLDTVGIVPQLPGGDKRRRKLGLYQKDYDENEPQTKVDMDDDDDGGGGGDDDDEKENGDNDEVNAYFDEAPQSNMLRFAAEVVVHAPLNLAQDGDEEAWEVASSIYDLDNNENGRPSTAPASTAAGPGGTQGPLLAKKRKPLSILDFDAGGQFALAGGKRGDRVVAVNNRIVVTGDQLMEEIEQMQLLGERNIVVEVKKTKRWDRSSTERLYEDAQHRTHRRKQLVAKHHPKPSFQPSISPSNAARSSTVEADGRSEYEEGGNDGEISSSSSSSSHTGGVFGREELDGGVFTRLWEHAERTKEDKKAAIAAKNAALSSLTTRQRSRRFRESPQEAKKRREKILRKSQALFKAGTRRQQARRNWEAPPPGAEYTFAPNREKTKSKGARGKSVCNSSSGSEAVHHRLYEHRKTLEEKKKMLQEQKEAKLTMECTFQPTIHSRALVFFESDSDENDGDAGDNTSTAPSQRSNRSGGSSMHEHQIEAF